MTTQYLRLWRLSLEVVPGDMWIGCYWAWKTGVYGDPEPMITRELHIYLCLLPCLPVHVVLGRLARKEETPCSQ